METDKPGVGRKRAARLLVHDWFPDAYPHPAVILFHVAQVQVRVYTCIRVEVC